MNFSTRSKLVHLLIGKSIIEAVFATSIAAGAYLITTNPNLKGWLDQADSQTVSGWAVDDAKPQERVAVQLFIDDKFVETRSAVDFRPDVHQAQRADDDWHGFVFHTPSLIPGEHLARVYAVHRGASDTRISLQMIGKPIRIRIGTQVQDPNNDGFNR